MNVDWKCVGTALYAVKIASEKLCGESSVDTRKLFDEIVHGSGVLRDLGPDVGCGLYKETTNLFVSTLSLHLK